MVFHPGLDPPLKSADLEKKIKLRRGGFSDPIIDKLLEFINEN